MKRIITICIITNIFIASAYSQDVKKITLATGTEVKPMDVISVDEWSNNRAVGYIVLNGNNYSHFGMFLIDNSNTITNSKIYSITNHIIYLEKICWSTFHGTEIYALAAYQESSNKLIPMVIEIDKATGTVNWAKKLNIPNIDEYSAFYPYDICFSGGGLKILCTGKPNSGSIYAKLQVIDFDLSTYNFQITELYDPNNLNVEFQQLSFIKTVLTGHFLYGFEGMRGDIAISGIEYVPATSVRKGFIYQYVTPYSSPPYTMYQTYQLNGKLTSGFQVNATNDGEPYTPSGGGIYACIENSDHELSIFTPYDYYNSTVTRQKDYTNTDGRFQVTGYGHPTDLFYNISNDFFVGYYGITDPNGYGYLRYDLVSGSINQNYYYDTKLDSWDFQRNTFSDYTDLTSMVCKAPIASAGTPYLYVISRNISASPDGNCTQTIPLTEDTHTLNVTNETMLASSNGPYTAADISVNVSDVITKKFNICVEYGRPANSGEWENEREEENVIKNPVNLNTQIRLKPTGLTVYSPLKRVKQTSLYSIDGKLIRMDNPSSIHRIEINFSSTLSTGIYVVKVVFEDNSSENKKVFLSGSNISSY